MPVAEDTRERDYCRKCNHVQSIRVGRYCPDCGTELTEKPEYPRCPMCGNDIRALDKFCPSCGYPQKEAQ
ncbi:MAG: zinc ribbon domain-containing protein [Dehalococcoidales bacterium]|nr:zinc ribbon domain-containing protein [Dehalococcoidales bacterium]